MQRRSALCARGVVSALLATLLVIVGTMPAYAYAYGTAVLADSPVGYLPSDAGSGTTLSNSGSGSTSLTCSSASWDATGLVGGSTSRLAGNGSAICSGGTGAGTPNGEPMGRGTSLEFWIVTNASTTPHVILHQWGSFASGQWSNQSMTLHGGGTSKAITWDVTATASGVEVSGTCTTGTGGIPSIDDGSPHMVDMTQDASHVQVYVDAVLCGSYSPSQTIAAGYCHSVLGKMNTPNGDGSCSSAADTLATGAFVGQFSWYNSTLSSIQITTHFNAGSGPPPSRMFVNPSLATRQIGQPLTYTFQSTDATGVDTTSSDTFTVGTLPSGVTCGSVSGAQVTCTASAVASYFLTFHDAHSFSASALLNAVDYANVFDVTPSSAAVVTGQQLRFDSFATDSAIPPRNISIADGFTVAAQSNQSCGAPGIDSVAQDWFVKCSWSAAGTYTVTFTDIRGHVAQSTITVTAAAATAACSTDIAGLACILTQVWNSIQGLLAIPGQIIGSLSALLTVSQTGKNYIDVAALGTGLVPGVTCRSGQTPTHPDGIRCLPFPISIPWDFIGVLSILDVTPTAPSITAHLVAPPINQAFTIDPTVILTSQVMTWVRGCELILFVVGLAIGTYRFVQAWGSL